MLRSVSYETVYASLYHHSRWFCTDLNSSPLAGIRILDLTRFVAGPLCTMILGDLGAEIYKIEELGKGDIMRKLPPFAVGTNLSCQFVSVNRNKQSVCINIKSQRGQEIVKDLAKKCDVLVENFVPGNLEKYGLGYDQMRSIAPELIYCSITGFGQYGPYRNKPGVDLIAASLGGFLHITGPENGDPCKAGVAVTDMMTGLYAYGAIIAALLNRLKTGRGEKINCNLFSTQVSSLTNLASNYLNAGQEAKRLGTAHVGLVPYETFKTKDGYLSMGTMNDGQFRELCTIIALPNLISETRFASIEGRVQNKTQLLSILRSTFLHRTTSEWCKIFEDNSASFPYGAVNTLQQVFSDPQTKAINIVKEVHSAAGPVKVLGPPVEFSNSVNKDASTVRVLKLRNPKPDKHVKWNEDTVDNEHLNKKKSKCCCIYKKPKTKFDESSSDTDDECENCFGHVEVKKKHKKEKHNQQPPDGNENDEESPENNSHGRVHSKCT